MAPCLSSPRGRSEPSRISSTLTPRQPRAEPGGAEAGCGEVRATTFHFAGESAVALAPNLEGCEC